MINKEVQLEKWGDAYGIRISREELSELGVSDVEATFELVAETGEMTLTPKKKMSTTLEELFENYDGPPPEKYEWDGPQGRELL